MSLISVNDLIVELFEENERLIDEFSINKKFVEIFQKYRQLLSEVCSESDINDKSVLKQKFDDLEVEYTTVDNDLRKSVEQKKSVTSELRLHINHISNNKSKRLKASEDIGGHESISEDNEDDDNEAENRTNLKFLSTADRLVEEDGSVVTERDPKNPLILVVRLNDKTSRVFGYRCNWSDCQYVSVSKPKLDTHLRSVHDRNGMFICQKCKKKFNSTKQLSIHSSSDHSKQYKCDYEDCGFHCRTRQHLNDHLRRHTGERPYVCLNESCGKGFATRQELRRHNNSVHSKENYVCEWPGCQLNFKSHKALTTHQTIHTMI